MVMMFTFTAPGMDRNRILYERELPGGGFVHVEEQEPDGGGPRRALISVERRRDPARRDGHAPPVIATAEASASQNVFRQLLEIATDNVQIARALLRWQSDGKARF
jgi:hypothetical protein